METVQAVYFCYAAKPANLKLATKTAKKRWILSFLAAKLPEKAWKIEISKMDEEDDHAPVKFYYPEDLETLDAETERGRAFLSQKQRVIIVNNLLTEHWGPWSLHSDHTATTSGHFSTLRFRTM